jgi:hypothetical protein
LKSLFKTLPEISAELAELKLFLMALQISLQTTIIILMEIKVEKLILKIIVLIKLVKSWKTFKIHNIYIISKEKKILSNIILKEKEELSIFNLIPIQPKIIKKISLIPQSISAILIIPIKIIKIKIKIIKIFKI